MQRCGRGWCARGLLLCRSFVPNSKTDTLYHQHVPPVQRCISNHGLCVSAWQMPPHHTCDEIVPHIPTAMVSRRNLCVRFCSARCTYMRSIQQAVRLCCAPPAESASSTRNTHTFTFSKTMAVHNTPVRKHLWYGLHPKVFVLVPLVLRVALFCSLVPPKPPLLFLCFFTDAAAVVVNSHSRTLSKECCRRRFLRLSGRILLLEV